MPPKRSSRATADRTDRDRCNMTRKQLVASITLTVCGLAIALIAGEAIVWLVRPTEYLYPRYQVSPEYGLIPFSNVVMVHGVPRQFEFHYTTNSERCRGPQIPPPNEATHPAVVVLGDSYTFGMGVSDGEEYADVMRRALDHRWTVLNLASPGWGLTQQIRRYYDIGAAYDPKVVVLQFGGNDPEDNLINPVTKVRDGEFVFEPSTHTLNWSKRLLAKSVLQRTQLYNFMRVRMSRIMQARGTAHAQRRAGMDGVVGGLPAPDSSSASAVSPQERIYAELLTLFAHKLRQDGRVLLVIAVDRHLQLFPHIDATVHQLEAEGALRYVEVLDWLHGMPNYYSADGQHVWGAAAHNVIGEHLAAVIASDTTALVPAQ